MNSGEAFAALAAEIPHEAVEGDELVSGAPTIGYLDIGTTVDGAEVGVWEITPGVVRDVEEEEIFVVLKGRATIEFADGRPAIEVSAGSVVRLDGGMGTTWTVHETLRKIYVLPPSAE